jgi:hypothetical protein
MNKLATFAMILGLTMAMEERPRREAGSSPYPVLNKKKKKNKDKRRLRKERKRHER